MDFEDYEALKDHRRSRKCEEMCVWTNCHNYGSLPSGRTPGSPSCSHSSNTPQPLLWQMLYRQRNGLTKVDWAPDPTAVSQTVPDGLPEYHPMFRFSTPIAPTPLSNMTGVPGSFSSAERLAGNMGGWMPLWSPSAQQSNPPPDTNMLDLDTSFDDLSPLWSLVENLWRCVNRTNPSWSSLTERMYRGAVRPPEHLPPIEHVSGTEHQIVTLEILAGLYEDIITGRLRRTAESWHRVAQMTMRILRGRVHVPYECPWGEVQPEPPTTPLAGPSQYRPAQTAQFLDPRLYDWNDYHQPGTVDDGSTTQDIATNQDSVPNAVLHATNTRFQVRPTTQPQNTQDFRSNERRASYASPASPSTGPAYSASSSMNFPRPDQPGPSGSQ